MTRLHKTHEFDASRQRFRSADCPDGWPDNCSNNWPDNCSNSCPDDNIGSGSIRGGRSTGIFLAILMATGSLGVTAQGAIAQEAAAPLPNIFYDGVSGSVVVDNNAFDLSTGALQNESHIPLPSVLPDSAQEGVSLPTRSDLLAPNSVEIRADVDYINNSFNQIAAAQLTGTTYTLDPASLSLTTQFDVKYSPDNHAFGEGIQTTVFDPDCIIKEQRSAFVRGDSVQIGPDGNLLPVSNTLTVNYGAGDTVELRVFNLRDNNAQPSESAIYFSKDGQFIVEDFQNGGDRDFHDGDYFQISGGTGEAQALEEVAEVTVETQIVETPLTAETRLDEIVETDVIATLQMADSSVSESKNWGSVEAPDAVTTRLGHASGAVTDNDEQLVYSRYSNESQVRLGSDGLGITGQLAPLVNNPSVPPTLFSGNLTFNPTVGNNEAGLSATVGITQFLTPTHRLATDVLGNVIANPNTEGARLVEPAGAFNNRKWVGYVPATPSETVMGSQLFSVNGIFDLPADQAVMITAADPQQVGRGNSAYTDNVGGLLIEKATGEFEFVPQWTKDGFVQSPIYLDEGAARRVIYALVPQQLGQALQLGQTYAVNSGSNGYQIAAGGFTVISADQQPQNFFQEMTEVYAVEDTRPNGNAVTDVFNGVPGFYANTPGGGLIPTVDVGLADEADARVGNQLFPLNVVVADPGQSAYAQTTRAAGFYLGGTLSGGIGNQQDTTNQTVSTVERATDELRTRRTLNTFATPLFQIDTIDLQTTRTLQTRGNARFDINSAGELTNVRFERGETNLVNETTSELGRRQNVVKGEEFLVSSVTSQTIEKADDQLISADQQTTSTTDSYANFSAVQGELALGGVFNFGNTPWTSAANTLSAELFVRDDVFGRGSGGSETGWRAEAVFHPFGEIQRAAYRYDAEGNAIPLYKTEPVLDANGAQVTETLTTVAGETVTVPVNRFLLAAADSATPDSEQRIAQTVGTGRARGPGVYLRLEDVLSDGDSAVVVGGLQFSF